MNKIDKQFSLIKKDNRMGLMTHIVVGYPSLKETEEIVLAMVYSGVDFIELQIPFSDPLADGPTIMRACEKALNKGIKVKDSFKLAEKLSKKVKIPLLFMAYYNTVQKYGTEKFCKDAKNAGISGLIVPDIPIEEEENEHFIASCKKADLYDIHVLSPSITPSRIEKNSKIAKGFIYCTARQGTTGVVKDLDPKLKSFLDSIRKNFNIPIAVGFGISNKERVSLLEKYADLIVVGSAVIDLIDNSIKEQRVPNIKNFIKNLII